MLNAYLRTSMRLGNSLCSRSCAAGDGRRRLERTLLNYHRFGQCFVLDGSKLLESVIYISSERTVPRCAELDHG